MTWWVKNRMLPLLAVVTVLASLLCAPGTGVLVALPNLMGGPGFASPVSLLIPLAAMIVYCQGIARQNMTLEHLAVRQIWRADLAVAAACIAVFAAGMVVDSGPVMVATLRNAIGYFGAALLGTWLFSMATASLLPLIWALLAAMGGLPFGDPSVVTWPGQPAGDITSWAVAVTLAIAGAFAYLAHHTTVADRLRQLRLPVSRRAPRG